MAEQEYKEVDDEKRARGRKRTSETKIAEVSVSKSKKRAKKALAETPEPAQAQNIFNGQGRHSEEYNRRSRLEEAARDVADGKITLEELDAAIHNAVTTARNIRLGDQGDFYNPPDQPTAIKLNMEAFSRSERAIAIR
jgi:hypothetical protein